MSRTSEGRTACASPLVSVIIPVYNVEMYLGKCLDSLFSQTLGPSRMEVICVDDGSTDGTPALLDGYCAAHANLIVERQENAGASAARNRGLEISSGKYIYFLDSDDWLSRPDALELLCARADAMKLDELIFCGDVAYEDADPESLFISRPRHFLQTYDYDLVSDGQETYVRLARNDDYPVVVWRRIYLRAFLMENELRFLPGIVHHDQIFTRECAALAGRVNCWDARFHTYFVRRDSITANKKKFPGKSIYSRLVGIRYLREFARLRLGSARPDFIEAFGAFIDQWSDINARQYREFSRAQRNEFWRSLAEEQRRPLRREMSAELRTMFRRRLNRCVRHPVQRLRAAIGARRA